LKFQQLKGSSYNFWGGEREEGEKWLVNAKLDYQQQHVSHQEEEDGTTISITQ
jgi:hypothetical protein